MLIGKSGEFCIVGDGLVRGYYNKLGFMVEKFIDNLFESGIKFYKLGDLVRWFFDGNIEYLGWIDS